MSPFKKIKNADAAAQILLKNVAIFIDADQILAELEKYPEYGNMLAISNVPNNFRVTKNIFQ